MMRNDDFVSLSPNSSLVPEFQEDNWSMGTEVSDSCILTVPNDDISTDKSATAKAAGVKGGTESEKLT